MTPVTPRLVRMVKHPAMRQSVSWVDAVPINPCDTVNCAASEMIAVVQMAKADSRARVGQCNRSCSGGTAA